MKERPIIFSGPEVRAILEGRKTQARRVIKPQPERYLDTENADGSWGLQLHSGVWTSNACPYGRPGDHLLVAAPLMDGAELHTASPLTPQYRVPRLTLEITDVRVQRLRDISEADAEAEGVEGDGGHPERGCFTSRGKRDAFAQAWADIHGPDAWSRNDWVWVLTFKVLP